MVPVECNGPAAQCLPARAEPNHQQQGTPTQHVHNERLLLVIRSHLVHWGLKGCAGTCANSATARRVPLWVLPGSPGRARGRAGSLVGDQQGFVPWAGGGSWVAFGLVEGRSLGCFHHPCLCPTGDCVCMHPTGTPDACVPRGTICVHISWEAMHAGIPQGPQVPASCWGPRVPASREMPASHRGACLRASHGSPGARVSRRAAAGAAPCPHACAVSPGEHLQVTRGWGGVCLVRHTCLLSTNRETPSPEAGATFVHTPVENRVRVGDCASKYRPGYLGSAALASPLSAARGVPLALTRQHAGTGSGAQSRLQRDYKEV